MGEESKRSLRRHLRDARDSTGPLDRSRADGTITELVWSLPELSLAPTLLAYRSMGSEVDTSGLMERAWRSGLTVALPRCDRRGRQLEWFVVRSFSGLCRGSFGIEEPDPRWHAPLDPALLEGAVALVPGVAFDLLGNRMGYGGGFYDTFLSRFEGTSVGLCREAQLLDSLEELHALESHDLPVDVVVSERRLLRFPPTSMDGAISEMQPADEELSR